MMKRLCSLLLVFVLLLPLAACGKDPAAVKDLEIEKYEKFGSVYLKITIDAFEALGFAPGDSVDVSFSNGYHAEDVPFYDGYYAKTGMLQLVAYHGEPYVIAAICNGDSLIDEAKLSDSDTVSVTLREARKYTDIQDAMGLRYTNDREKYASDQIFANFRELRVGEIAENLVFRSSSPCNNSINRAEYASAFCEQAGIAYMIDLADNPKEAAAYFEDRSVNNPYWKTLWQDGHVLPLGMSMNFKGDIFREGTLSVVRAFLRESGPFLVYCNEGKDRTGFFCLLIGMAAGASFEELERDFMTTYENYYGITKEKNPKQYAAVVENRLCDMLAFLTGSNDPAAVSAEEMKVCADRYFSACGLTDEEISEFHAVLTGTRS